MRKHSLGGFAVMAALCSSNALADAVDDAFFTCALFERTGLTTSCEVQGWGSTVDVRMDMNSGEARKTCAQVAQMIRDQRGGALRLASWKLKIFSPYSGDQPIVVCNF